MSLTIETRKGSGTTFGDLKPGDVFQDKDRVFLKTYPGDSRNAVWLSGDTGFLCFFADDIPVRRLNAKLVLEKMS